MPNPRLLINLLKGFQKVKGIGALGKKAPKKIPYQKWTEDFPKPKWDPNSQSYKFEVKGQLQEIYRDPEFGGWFDGQRLTPGSQTRSLYLGDTKEEAIKKSTDLAIENIKMLKKFLKGESKP